MCKIQKINNIFKLNFFIIKINTQYFENRNKKFIFVNNYAICKYIDFTQKHCEMKHLLIFLILVAYFHGSTLATYKIIAETSIALNKIVVLRGETGHKDELKSWRTDNRSFMIESADMHLDSLQLENSISFRLYETSTKKSTKWIRLSLLSKISFAECFEKYFDKTLEINDFVVPNYLSESLNNNQNRLRYLPHSNSIFHTHYAEFSQPAEISFEWKNTPSPTQLIILNLLTEEVMFHSTETTKNSFAFSDVLSEKKWEYNKSYIARLIYKSEESMQSDSLVFKILPIVLPINQHTIFISPDSVHFAWNTILPNVNVSIQTMKGKTVWKSKKYTQKTFNLMQTHPAKIAGSEVYIFVLSGKYQGKLFEQKLAFFYALSPSELTVLSQFLSK